MNRPGDGLFGESLVCVEAKTGKRVWHFQMAHHGLWDYDLPAAPNLVDVNVNGQPVKAVAQTSKQGFLYVFDRVTGKPIWPIEERPVPQSQIPGEQTSPTQPFPTKPAAFDRQGVTEADLVDFTPELHARLLLLSRSTTMGLCSRLSRSRSRPSRFPASQAAQVGLERLAIRRPASATSHP